MPIASQPLGSVSYWIHHPSLLSPLPSFPCSFPPPSSLLSLQLVSDKSQERRLGLSVLNALQRADGKRRLWNKPGRWAAASRAGGCTCCICTPSLSVFLSLLSHLPLILSLLSPSSEEDMYRAIVSSYEERQKVRFFSSSLVVFFPAFYPFLPPLLYPSPLSLSPLLLLP